MPKPQPNTTTPFSDISVNGQVKPDDLLEVINAEESEALAAIVQAERRLSEVKQAREKARQVEQAQLAERRIQLFEKARLHREAARNETSSDAKVKLIAEAETAEAEARSILLDGDPAPTEHTLPESPKFLGISTNQGILGVAVLALISAGLFYMLGTSLIQDEANDSAVRMMNSVGLRVITNFFIFGLALLVPIGFIYLIFPSVFAYWHNRIESHISLISDLENATEWQRIAFFCFCYGLPVWAFVQLMQVIFG